MNMRRTKLVLETAPNSGLGVERLAVMLKQWQTTAEGVERLLKPSKDKTLLWQLTFNWHQQTAEEFETTECLPSPLIYGRVSLVLENNWEESFYPYVLEFNGLCHVLHSNGNASSSPLIDERDLPAHIVSFLRKEQKLVALY